MKIENTKLHGVWLVTPDVYEDFRGKNIMIYRKDLYENIPPAFSPSLYFPEPAYPKLEFLEENITINYKGILTGMHYSPSCWKLYECFYGRIYYNIINYDEKDSEFGKSQSFILTGENHLQIIKSPQYAAGYLTLSDMAILHYKQSEIYNPEKPNQITFKYDDERFKLWWPKVTNPFVLSQRDEAGRYRQELSENRRKAMLKEGQRANSEVLNLLHQETREVNGPIPAGSGYFTVSGLSLLLSTPVRTLRLYMKEENIHTEKSPIPAHHRLICQADAEKLRAHKERVNQEGLISGQLFQSLGNKHLSEQ